MTARRLGSAVFALLATGAAIAPGAWAAAPSPTTTDLVRSKIDVPVSAEAKDPSDVGLQVSTYPAGAVRPWFTSPGATFVAVKSGAVTVFRGDATSCTSQTYSAGQGYFAPAGEARLIRNDGSSAAEIYVARVALPVGAAPRADAPKPAGAGCPDATAGAPEPSTTDLARSTLAEPFTLAATEASDVLLQVSNYPAGAVRPWFSSPGPTFVAVKSGSVTVFRGDASSCTSQTYSAGQAYFGPGGSARLLRNDGSSPAEIYVARLALPVGAAPRVDAPNPGGANCPDAASATSTVLPKTGSAASRPLTLAAGVLLAIGGLAVAAGQNRRRALGHR